MNNKVIAHRILKEQNDLENVGTILRNSVYNSDSLLTFLIKKAVEMYDGKSCKNFGIFREEHENSKHYPFRGYLKQYIDGEIKFVDFSCFAMNHLQNVFKRPSSSAATGGDIFFIERKDETVHHLYVLMLKTEKGVSLDQSNLDIIANEHLDLSKLHTAAKIDINKFLESSENEKYISFIRGRSNTYLQYYFEFIGAKEFENTRVNTSKFIQAIEDYIVHKEFNAEDKNDFRTRVYSYCSDKSRDYVDIENFSTFISTKEPEDFFDFVNRNNYDFNGIFEVDLRTLKSLNVFAGENKNMHISFKKKFLDSDDIIWGGRKLTILSNILPMSLQQKLDEYTAKNDND